MTNLTFLELLVTIADILWDLKFINLKVAGDHKQRPNKVLRMSSKKEIQGLIYK